ncbi:MAG: hypothetical protein DRJ18_00200 [Candidatus Methanomethylicota archaeon]|nr:MAG: hypothetical protein DRJ18_00200 [Candidatus Verstraetearchaeota archaeon]
MKTKPKTTNRLLYILLALTLTFTFSLQVKAASSPTFYWSPQVAFKLPAYNTIVTFADWAYFTSFSWNKWNSSKITFNNLLVGSGSALSSLCLSSPDTDITILSANSESVKLNLADTDKILQIWNLDVKTVKVGGAYFTKDDFFVSYTEWQACNQDSVFQNETLTAIKAVSSTTVTLGLTAPSPVWQFQAEGENVTWYFRADTHTVNGILGYRLAEAPSSSEVYDSVSADGAYITYYGVRVWIVHSSGALEELTDGTPVAVVSRNENGEGLQNATWSCPGYSNIINTLMVKVYQRFGSGEWNLRATFISDNSTLFKLPESTWTFYYYTSRQYDGAKTSSTFYWGADYNSRIEFCIAQPNPFELALWHLMNQNLIGFIMTSLTYYLGSLAYGIFLFALAITLYNRFEDVSATTLAMLLLIGGGAAGGIISILVPASGLQLSWALFVLGIAILLYKLVRGNG